jgi:hypothetical protein
MITATPEEFKQPWLQWSDEGQDWTLVESWQFQWGQNLVLKRLTIPAGQDTDKASVPFARDVFRHDGPWEGPALAHDMAYKCKGRWPVNPVTGVSWYETSTDGGLTWQNGGVWSRRDADNMLAFMGRCAGAKHTGVYKWACKLWPVNWFKGF